MESITVHLKSRQIKKLAVLAKRKNVSIEEIHRQAIDYYLDFPEEDREELKQLDFMLDLLSKSTAETNKALDETIIALREMKKARGEHKVQEQNE